MPRAKRQAPLYQRGPYTLDWDRSRDGSLRSPNLAVFWYDDERRGNRSASTGTADLQAAKAWLDAFYLERTGGCRVCPACNRQFDHTGSLLVLDAITNYQLLHGDNQESSEAIRSRLAHVVAYVATLRDPRVTCDQVDERWISAFRRWAEKQPIVSPTGKVRARSLSTVENSVLQLAAAIRFAKLMPAFKPRPVKELNNSPQYRSEIDELAAMFRFCVRPEGDWGDKERARRIRERAALRRFLIVSVATWARPDAAYDLSTDPKRGQWHSKAGAIALNPRGRRQTKKYRATVPCAWQFALHLEAAAKGFFVGPKSIRSAWDSMALELGLPAEGEAGTKLIRRSVSTIARARLGEEHWIQGRIMLGHVQPTTSDIYALRAMENMGKVLAVTESIIDEIEALCPGAFALPDSNVVTLGRKV
jgi:hypothetical protein